MRPARRWRDDVAGLTHTNEGPMTRTDATASTRQPNILILCMDQWQTHMDVPAPVRFPAMERLEAQGVSFDRQYCTVPICTPSRASMWTGVHAKQTGLWDGADGAGGAGRAAE